MRLENSLVSEVTEQFSSGNIFHEQIEIPAVLADSFKVNDEWVVNFIQDFALVDNVISLLGFDDFSLFHDLHTCAFLCFFVPGKLYLTKGPYIEKEIPTPRRVSIA